MSAYVRVLYTASLAADGGGRRRVLMGVCLCELIGMDAYSQFHITRRQLPRRFPKLDMESVYVRVFYTATLAAQAWQSILDALWRLRSAAYQPIHFPPPCESRREECTTTLDGTLLDSLRTGWSGLQNLHDTSHTPVRCFICGRCVIYADQLHAMG
jgi:hypothetical protein